MPRNLFVDIRALLVVDVGANRGQFLIDVRDALPETRVVAFEPLPGEFAVLDSIHGRNPQSDLRMVAVGEHVGEVAMHVSRSADSSSVLEITSEQSRYFPGTEPVGVITVQMSTLDEQLMHEEIPSRSILKIDVQGGELDVLRGGDSVLRRFGYVLVEVSFVELYAAQPLAGEVIQFLSERGFILDRVLSLSFARNAPVQADVLFRNGALDGG